MKIRKKKKFKKTWNVFLIVLETQNKLFIQTTFFIVYCQGNDNNTSSFLNKKVPTEYGL